jgi:RNA polymerase sigma-70 factor, ECF subfamily
MSALTALTHPSTMTPNGPPDQPDMPEIAAPLDPESSFALVIRARAGDHAAVEQLFSRYSGRLRGWAHGRLPAYARTYGDTQDLVQDTMIQVFKSLDRFQPQHAGAFLAFVRRTLHNKLIDRIRAARSRGPLEPFDGEQASPEPSPFEEAVAAQLLDRYEQGLERLKPEYQEAIVVRIELGLPWAEVKDVLNKPSIPAAQMAVHRAILALAHEMEHQRKR